MQALAPPAPGRRYGTRRSPLSEYISLHLSLKLRTNSGPLSRIKWEIHFYKEVFRSFIEFRKSCFIDYYTTWEVAKCSSWDWLQKELYDHYTVCVDMYECGYTARVHMRREVSVVRFGAERGHNGIWPIRRGLYAAFNMKSLCCTFMWA